MTEFRFQGKEIIHSYHLTVPPRLLCENKSKSYGKRDSGNKIIYGDNLHALKALLPEFRGKIDCIYMDPPYNTGHGDWKYNDNVDHPKMIEWFKKEVADDDMLRHDKWMCMMWPRLNLLRELLADNGVIFVSIDDNEVTNLKLLMNETFGDKNFVSQITVINNLKGNNDEFGFAGTHEYLLVYTKNKDQVKLNEFKIDEEALEKWDQDDIGFYKKGAELKATGEDAKRSDRENMFYPIYITKDKKMTVKRPNTKKYHKLLPKINGEDGRWRWMKKTFEKQISDVIVFKTGSGYTLYKKQRPKLGDLPTIKPKSVFYKPEYSSGNGTGLIKKIFGKRIFDNPKPLQLIKDILEIGTSKNSIILDATAGSGTTGHAVLSLNKNDGGSRKFIMIEQEQYANEITAERIRRVIKGISSSDNTEIKNGLGGSFKYYELGDPIEKEDMLSGTNMPDYSTLAKHLFYVATGLQPPKKITKKKNGMFYNYKKTDYYLFYKEDVKFMRSAKGVLDDKKIKQISKNNKIRNSKSIVFAASKDMGQNELAKLRIEFYRLPDAVNRRL